ncbi:hypothetical protein EZ456_22855 [Pedobacter psychrodurus]|uniref:HNH endonuclease n=1 Tax=Pedobacter psychrodurus TaxID=2530456 RepID=A0A4R0PGA9_9SPHI|nr:hypothetical protein [Pedobacter psychrodurus]TCD17459.1 hypothetical protein EZ456_22855 [Pedobacter psychrodurus]
MTGTCKLCLNESELKQSHIIPEFMYQNVYDENPKRFYSLNVVLDNDGQSSSKILQKGVRERLLCEECEGKFSKYEDYAAETIYAKRNRNKAYIAKSSVSADGIYFLYEYEGFSYKEFKIFLMSLLWRVIISESYHTPEIDAKFVEQLRTALHNENPLDYDDFGCLVQVLKDRTGQIVGKLILQPYMTGGVNSDVLNILIDGFVYSFYLQSKMIPESQKTPFLKQDGKMEIIGRLLEADRGLVDKLKAAFDFFTKKIKNNGS